MKRAKVGMDELDFLILFHLKISMYFKARNIYFIVINNICISIIHVLQHFVDPNGPTPDFPDPLPADGSHMKKTRLHWKSRNKV